jgi:hypothetical protein
MLMGPQLAALRMKRRALHVAMAIAPDLGLGAGAFDELIVGRNAAFGSQPDHLAEMVAEVLRFVAIAEVIAGGETDCRRGPARCGSRSGCRSRADHPAGTAP